MNRRAVRLLLAIPLSLALAATACGSEGDSTAGDSLPEVDGPTTEVLPTQVPATEVPATEVTNSPQTRLDDARATWEQNGPTSYTLVTRLLCFCPQEEWSDTVVDGEVTDHVPLTLDSLSDPGPTTMEVLFDQVQAALDEGYASIELSFDRDSGALQQFFVDVNEQMADEEYGIEVVSLDTDPPSR